MTADPQPLAYASPGAVPPPSVAAFRVAVACGAVPLVAGVSFFLAYLLTRDMTFAEWGFYMLPIGVVLFLVGALALAYHVMTFRRRHEPLGRRCRLKVGGAALLLLVNFPAAAFCVVFGTIEMHRYRVEVTNASNATVERFAVVVDGVPVEIGPIAPGQTARCSFFPRQDGAITYVSSTAGVPRSGELVSYADHGPVGFDAAYQIGPGGVVGVRP